MKRLKKFEDYKYHATVGDEPQYAVACVPDEDVVGKKLAIASLEDLRVVLPKQALEEGFEDLLPIAANACVVNRGNKRGDIISTKTALSVYQGFANKFINIEHDRKLIVGFLASAGLSEFSSQFKVGLGSKPLEKEAIASTTDPFNVSVAGYVFAVPYPEIAQQLIDANDPNNDAYMGISLSWEIAFDNYKIAIGSADLADCEIFESDADIAKYSPYLKCNKGSGKLPDGRPVYRLIEDGVIPLGVALTFAPAAEVCGVFTTANMTEAKGSEEEKEQKEKESSKKISLTTKANVTTNIQSPMKKTLKSFEDLKALNDENVGEYSLANVGNLIEAKEATASQKLEDKIAELAKEHQKKIEAEANAKTEAQTKLTEAVASVEALNKKVKVLEEAQASAEQTQKFNDRMQGLDEGYELTDGQRKAIASQIRGLDDTGFSKWKTEVFEAFASKKTDKQKAAKEDAADGGKDDEDENADGTKKAKKTAKASDDSDEAKKVAAEALKSAATKKAAIANVQTPTDDPMEKYRKAFSVGAEGGLEIVKSSRR